MLHRSIQLKGFFCIFIIFSAAVVSARSVDTKVLKDSSAQQFYYLFDGNNVDHWQSVKSENFPHDCWKVVDGELRIINKTNKRFGSCGDLITRKKYSNFELVLEYKVEPRANSGIKYFFQTKTGLGLEYQLIDDERQSATHRTADLYDLYECNEKKMNPPGQWNSIRIIACGLSVEHWLNGIKVLEYERGSEDFIEKISKSKFKNSPNFGLQEEGHILLQDHGGGVSFRNIRIREIKNSIR
ncbi:DUF1080 domain-containing protein [candidate division KSB1 bacterium]|nr:DUF1080 domain-containing protein [candidate division KSB1 bacterium]